MTLPLQPRGRVLVLAPDRDSPPKRDWTGAFRPAGQLLERHLGATVVSVPVPTVDPSTLTIAAGAKQAGFEGAARVSLAAIERYSPAHLVMLCHGWATGLQLGFRSAKQRGRDRENIEALLELLAELRASGILRSVCLFACSAGDEPASGKSSPGTGDGSIADLIRDRTGAPVVAHWTVGHATRNPDLIVFDAGTAPLIGGTAVQRSTPLYRNAVRLLCGTGAQKAPRGDVRPAWTSLPLVTSWAEMHELLSQAAA